MKKHGDARVYHQPTPHSHGPRGIHGIDTSSIGRHLLRVFDFSGNGSEVRAGLSYGFEVEFTPNRD
jgi:hypothetical protein